MQRMLSLLFASAFLMFMFSGVQAQDIVTFQVNMSVKMLEGVFDPGAGDVVIATGSFNGWSTGADSVLTDADVDSIYTGTFNLTGTSSPVFFKYVILQSGGGVVWEGDPNRQFDLTGSPQTLPVDFFDRDSLISVTGTVLFQVNVSVFNQLGVFTPGSAQDTMLVYGAFNNWGPNPPSNAVMQPQFGNPDVWELEATVAANIGEVVNYKYFAKLDTSAHGNVDGWEEPPTQGGGNRQVVFQGITGQVAPMSWFMDITPAGVVNQDVNLHLSVDMRPATDPNLPQPFDPATDSVFFSIEDQFQGSLQGWSPFRGPQQQLFYQDVDGDTIYTLDFTLSAPTYYALVYRVAYGPDVNSLTFEGGGFGFGKSRTRYIWDGSGIPTDYTFPMDVFTFDPPLVVEPNPHITGIEDDANNPVPVHFTLEQNYPNPFNPSTTIRFSLEKSANVNLTIFNVLGQKVRTLANGKFTPGAQQVVWDGRNDAGLEAASGVYYYRITVDNNLTRTRKMVLLR